MQTDFTKLLVDFKTIPKHKRIKTFLEISGYPHYENVCSNILQFYLNPNEEHGLKDLLINSLVHIVDSDFKVDSDFEDIEVYREHKTIANNRLDLLTLTENYVIGIENKIFHHLHNDLADYSNTILSFCYNQRKAIKIVLSLNKLTSKEDIEKTKNNGFYNITYEQLFENIKQNIGKYLTSSNIGYVNHLNDFIKSTENLTSKTMDNKALWAFFKNNAQAIKELTDSFNEYLKSLNQKMFQLNDAIPKNEFAPLADKQWIFKECYPVVLVHDYTILSQYKVAIDAVINASGWSIQIFGRNDMSHNYLFNVMCKDKDFLPNPIESYEIGKRLIFQKYDTEVDLTVVSESLVDALKRIENYKTKVEQ